MHYTSHTPDEFYRYIGSGLAVNGTIAIGDVLSDVYVWAWVNMAGRPYVADLARIHRVEVEGDTDQTWVFSDPLLPKGYYSLEVVFKRPVKTNFHIVFEMPKWIDVLGILAKYGKLALLPGNVPEWSAWGRKHQVHDQRSLIQQLVAEFGPQGFSIELDAHGREVLNRALVGYYARHGHRL